MVNAGRVAIVPQGEWSADATYKRLDAVTHNNTLYFAKKEVPAGTETTNTEYWSKSIVGGAGAIATTEDAGIVKPDGTTITIDDDGTIHGQSEITVDGTTITLDEAKGIISLAKTLQEKIKTIDNKLPSTSVVNNNTTTEAGFALDARQANPTIEGTVANQILKLNNDSILSDWHVLDCTANIPNYISGEVRYITVGHICHLNIKGLHVSTQKENTIVKSHIAGLPTPVGNLQQLFAENTQYAGELWWREDGVLEICYTGVLGCWANFCYVTI